MFKWLSPIIGFFYIVLGVTVIIYKFFVVFLDELSAYALGALLIVYGFYRIYRGVSRFKQERYEEE